ncbi:MAG: ADP-ribosylglycohydrolase family protein [Elusimicrobia bacterium]|nr:ADP-ribosylglycohydrolase family protein [Elusimicrobiota bacterium]
MIGAVAGDIIGSVYEFDEHNIKTKEFPLFSPECRFTDDTVLTVALADTVLTGVPYAENLRKYYRLYPHAGYGGNFARWARTDGMPAYGSFGNGAAMRISPAGFAYGTLEETLGAAARFTEVTHDHPEGVRGAQATAASVFLGRTGASKAAIKSCLEERFGYDLSRSIADIRPGYSFKVACQFTVPEAVTAFLESTGYEDAVRTAVSLGGDSDTLACITGGIAQAFYGGVPEEISKAAYALLDDRLRAVTRAFMDEYLPAR